MSSLAALHFIPSHRGGRKHPPVEGYSTVARFEADPMPREFWSLTLRNLRPLRGNEFFVAEVSFLSEQGPLEFLKAGERFELLEGRRIVAKGVCIPDTVPIPAELSEFDLALIG